jgi:hypothetical protein
MAGLGGGTPETSAHPTILRQAVRLAENSAAFYGL